MYYSIPVKAGLYILDKVLNGVITCIEKTLPDGPQFTDRSNAPREERYTGDKEFIDKTENARWSLGFGEKSLVPTDWRTKRYYLGGYFMPQNKFNNFIDNVVDDMRARAIAIDDNSGRGAAVFATVDSIGIPNKYVRMTREKFSGKAAEKFPDKKIKSVNVCSTHTHSCIDTEGLWTGGIDRIKKNFKLARKKALEFIGADPKYVEFLTDKISDAMIEAVGNMTDGNMTYCRKDIGEGYFSNKNRPSATALETKITRITFTPDDKSVNPTLIAFSAAHPDVAGLPTSDGQGTGHELSGDYIYYMGEYIKSHGYNFMFFNGAICAIYMSRGLSNDSQTFSHRYEQSIRYGVEMAKIFLAMNETKEEVEKRLTDDEKRTIAEETEIAEKNHGKYTLWYENQYPVKDMPLEPKLNIRIENVDLKVTNPIILLAGKLGLADFAVIKDPKKKKYSIRSEVGAMELGELKFCMVPGEYCCDLLKGGDSLYSAGSYSGKDFNYPTLWDIFGDDTICIGLANDEVGYIVPDNDYVLSDFKRHYHEELSLGRETGSLITKGFMRLKSDISRRL